MNPQQFLTEEGWQMKLSLRETVVEESIIEKLLASVELMSE